MIAATVVWLAAAPASAQPPAMSDVAPEEVREAWERTDYGSGPDRRIHLPRLEDRDIFTYGWIEYGIGANNWGAPFNGPITMADRAWQGQLNQLYVVTEREVDGSNGWDIGGRVDVLFGTDSPWADQAVEIGLLEKSGLTEAELSAVFFDNAARLLGM